MVPDDTIADLEAILGVGPNFEDLAGYVAPEDGRPVLDEDTEFLDVPVEGVDGDCSVADDDLIGTRGWERGVADLKGGVGFVKPGGLVD